MDNKWINSSNYITMTIRFKQQGDGRKSWVIDEKEIIYESPINKIHNEMLEKALKKHDYMSLGEVLLWVGDEDFGDEATALIDWWRTTCKMVIEYQKSKPNEENVVAFLETLPKFTHDKKNKN